MQIEISEGNNLLNVALTPYGGALEFPNIDVLSISGVSFLPDGSLAQVISQPNLFLTIKVLNKNITLYSDTGTRTFYAQVNYEAFQPGGRPVFKNYASISLIPHPDGYYNYRPPPFEFTVTVSNPTTPGSWSAGVLYSAQIQIGGRSWDGIDYVSYANFALYNFIRPTSSGSV